MAAYTYDNGRGQSEAEIPTIIDPPRAPEPDPDSLDDPATLQSELTMLKDSYLRLGADFANYKKRTRRDAEQQAAAQKDSFISELLPVLDNLERALAGGTSEFPEQLRQGVAMTVQQLNRLLVSHGIETSADLGEPFDPHRQQALSLKCDPQKPDHTILEVIQRGYHRGSQLLRPAQVVVNDLSSSTRDGRAG